MSSPLALAIGLDRRHSKQFIWLAFTNDGMRRDCLDLLRDSRHSQEAMLLPAPGNCSGGMRTVAAPAAIRRLSCQMPTPTR